MSKKFRQAGYEHYPDEWLVKGHPQHYSQGKPPAPRSTRYGNTPDPSDINRSRFALGNPEPFGE
jgi:hypothetical protein